MRRLLLILIIVAVATVVALSAATWAAQAAPPPEGPPGLVKALAAQIEHNPRLLATPGVVGTAVGLRHDGVAVVRVFTARPGVERIPAFLDGVPVAVQVAGKLMALKRKWNTAPVVTIVSPAEGAHYGAGAAVPFVATASDWPQGNLSSQVVWESSLDGYLGTGAGFSLVLSAGTHVITAAATDLGGKTGRDAVTITVAEAHGQPATTDLWPRPVPIGISTGNCQSISAGTIACRVVDASGDVYALSNVHVFAPNDIDGQSQIGVAVTQPGLYDVPSHTYDPTLHLGVVAACKPINGSIFAFNDIDAAIALTDRATLGTSTPVALGGYGVPNSVTRTATLNMAVQKFGRTTMLTRGTVTGVNATMAVGYDDDWYAWFTGQVIVETSGVFEQAGDSGSLVVTGDAAANPVGLLFAGNAEGTMAIVNPIDAVLDHFGVEIDGK
jgi:hypothetical protein